MMVEEAINFYSVEDKEGLYVGKGSKNIID